MNDREHLYCLLAVQNGFVSHGAASNALEELDLKSEGVESQLPAAFDLSHEDVGRVQQIFSLVLDRYGQDASRAVQELRDRNAIPFRFDGSLLDTSQDAAAMSTEDAGPPPGPESLQTIAAEPLPAAMAGKAVNENRFQILHEHARGGLGVVHLAKDEQFAREVALKQIRSDRADDQTHRLKFVREAQVTGQLEHPGIVPIYSMGNDQIGRPFYAMRFIHGKSLADAISEMREEETQKKESFDTPRLRQLLRRIIDTCNAMAYAHDRKVLHRDLKPANVMLGKYGETLVVDWGLAKRLGSTPEAQAVAVASPGGPSGDSNLETVQGQFMGTVAYASPEQLMGDIANLSSRSDVYSLGAMLFETLTGRAPIKNVRSTEDALAQLKSQVEQGCSAIEPRIPPALAAICDRAMRWKPDERYQDALALADDLEKWLDDREVTAYRDPFIHRAFRWARKNQAKATAYLVGGLATVLLLSGYFVLKSDAARRLADVRATAAARVETEQRRGLQDQVDKFEAKGDLKGVIGSLEKLKSMNGGLTNLQALRLAEKYFLDQQPTRSREILEALDEQSLPKDLLALRNMILGDVLYGTTDEVKGRELLSRSLESGLLDDARAAYVRGVIAPTPTECMQELSDCLILDPANSMARVRLSMTQMIVGQPRQAIENARIGKLLAPQDWRFNMAIAFARATMLETKAMEAELATVEETPETAPLAKFCRLIHELSRFLDQKFQRVQPELTMMDTMAFSRILTQIVADVVPAVMASQQADGLTIPRLGWVGEMHHQMGSLRFSQYK